MLETLQTCIRTGDFGPLRHAYGAHARLEAFLPIGNLVRHGPDEIISLFAGWWPSEGTFAHWSATAHKTGAEVVFERHPVEEERPWTSRHWHDIHMVDGSISRHLVWSDRSRHVGHLAPLPEPIAALVEDGDRTPLYEGGGASGSRLERIVMADGARFVLKHISPQRDLLLRVSNDAGKEATLFTSGLLERVADVIDYPVVAVAPEEDGWAILMRDVSDSLLDEDDGRVGRRVGRRILRTAGRLHEAFRGERTGVACTVVDRLRFLGPQVMERESSGPDALARWVRGSWEVFFDLVPHDIGDAVAAIHDDPGPLADQLTKGQTTLIHGDLWAPNIGLSPERIILLDWALACEAPAEMEYAFWVLWNCGFMGATPGELLEDVRADARDLIDERTMLLALLGEFVSNAGAKGWAWNSVNHLDPDSRERDREELRWWIDRARECLDRAWSPV